MSKEISVGTFRADFNRLASMVDDEWKARRPDEEAPGGYAPSKEFQTFRDKMRAMRDSHYKDLMDKMQYGQNIEQAEVDTLKNLDELLITMDHDPKHQNTRKMIQDHQEGKNPHFSNTSAAYMQFQRYVDDRKQGHNSTGSIGTITFRLD